MFALGIVLTVASLLAVGLYAMRARIAASLVRQVALIVSGHRFIGGNIGIERIEILRAADAAQREPAGRDQIGRPAASSPERKSDDASMSRSTELHIEAMRLTSLTAGPTTVKSSRSSLPILP